MSKSSGHDSFNHPFHRSSPGLSQEELRRLELLKLQKELQRKEKERAAWRKASEPTNVFRSESPVQPAQKNQFSVKPKKGESTFFAKLRLGRLLD